MSSALAILGGPRLRERPFPSWPRSQPGIEDALIGVVKGLRVPRDAKRKEFDLADRFERTFAELHDGGHVVSFRTASAAVHRAVQALGLSPRDEVIIPAYADTAVAHAVVSIGAVPVFTDVDPKTLTLDPVCAEINVTRRTKAIVVAHFAGQPADMERVAVVADRHGLKVLEDASHAPLARRSSRSVGTFGDVACFTFESSKNISIGGGGVVMVGTVSAPRLDALLRDTDPSPDQQGSADGSRMTEDQAAGGLAQLGQAEVLAFVRERGASFLAAALSNVGGLRPLERDPATSRHAYHLFVARYDPDSFGGLSRRGFLMAMNAEGIPAQPGWPCPLHRLPPFEAFPPPVTTQVADSACAEVVWFPQNILLADHEDILDVVRAVEKIRAHADQLAAKTDI
ncbi:MAG: DegT/DnrJ/EryC1/StrS family aminotransferase [Armatimonadota bacterium]